MTFFTDISGFLLWMVAKSCSWWTKSPWETPWKWRLNLLGKAWNWMGDFHCYVWLKVTQNPEFDGLESLLTGHCMGIFSDTAASWIHILHETPIRPHISPKKSLVSNNPFWGTRRSSLGLPMVALALVARFGNSTAWRMWVKSHLF